MANKTLLVQGLTPTTVGAAATTGALDITKHIFGTMPTLESPMKTSRWFSTLLPTKVVEGKFQITIPRKRYITIHDTTAAIHDATGNLGASLGPVSTAAFKPLVFDLYDFTLDQSWEMELSIDKKKDPLTQEKLIFTGIGAELRSKRAAQAAQFWKTFSDEIDATTKKSVTYPTYVSAKDGVTKASPDLTKELSLKTGDADAIKAAKIIDAMIDMVDEVDDIGVINTAHEGYPYAEGTESATLEFVVKKKYKKILSHDPRFMDVGRSNQIVTDGRLGTINNVPIYQDSIYDSTCTQDITLIMTGEFSPVALVEELSDAIEIFPHPTKPTRLTLVEGAGAYDAVVLPYVNLSRNLTVKTS